MLKSQVSFFKDSYFLGQETNHSLVPVAIIDINSDLLDDLVVLDNGNRLKGFYQTQEVGSFLTRDYGMVAPSEQFAMGLGDLDNDGWKEIFIGGRYDGVKILKSFNKTTDYLQWDKTESDFYTQNISFVDYNEDGLLDLHVNDDDNFPKLYKN